MEGLGVIQKHLSKLLNGHAGISPGDGHSAAQYRIDRAVAGLPPPEKASHGPGKGLPGVGIVDFHGEKLDHSRRGILTGVPENGGKSLSGLGNQISHDGDVSVGRSWSEIVGVRLLSNIG
jgi:hypothetical protein